MTSKKNMCNRQLTKCHIKQKDPVVLLKYKYKISDCNFLQNLYKKKIKTDEKLIEYFSAVLVNQKDLIMEM